jgi:hypothetical protein
MAKAPSNRIPTPPGVNIKPSAVSQSPAGTSLVSTGPPGVKSTQFVGPVAADGSAVAFDGNASDNLGTGAGVPPMTAPVASSVQQVGGLFSVGALANPAPGVPPMQGPAAAQTLQGNGAPLQEGKPGSKTNVTGDVKGNDAGVQPGKRG